MSNTYLDKKFWSERYQNNQTGWDIGHASIPLVTFFQNIQDKDLKILIPGAGNSYEAEYLYHRGFKNVFILDIAKEPIENFKKRVADFPKEHIILGDFFNVSHTFDVIVEQTFFCALSPSLRENYVKKMHQSLQPKGILAGVLFNFPLSEEGPPFGGSKEEYLTLFTPYFTIKKLEPCYNSIKPREGRELFAIFEKK